MKTIFCEIWIKIEVYSLKKKDIHDIINMDRILFKINDKLASLEIVLPFQNKYILSYLSYLKLDCEELCAFQTIKEKDVLLIYCNFLFVKSGKHKFTWLYTCIFPSFGEINLKEFFQA
jgi:hypothetical protein